jgi:quercetin dioxygenase-like cupin family protein
MNWKLQSIAAGLLCLTALASAAQPAVPEPILPEALRWTGPPSNPKLKGAWVIGAESEPGMYAFRVMLKEGGRIAPHTHPDTRYSTVLSGTLYVGFGEQMDDSQLVAIPAGAVYVAPKGVPHYLYAKDGDVVYQEGGAGPTATVPLGK